MSPLGPKKKGIRFNLYWMYSLIALVLIGLYYMNDNTMSKEVNWTEFEKIAKEGGITRLTVFAKKDYAEAQLNDSTAKRETSNIYQYSFGRQFCKNSRYVEKGRWF